MFCLVRLRSVVSPSFIGCIGSIASIASIAAVGVLGGCGADPGIGGVDASGGGTDSGSTFADSGPTTDGGPIDNGCEPPQMMIVLDRSGSMSKEPNGTEITDMADAQKSRWHIAVTAIESVTVALQEGVDFGLTLYPLDADDFGGTQGDCSNLETWIDSYLPAATDDAECNPAEVVAAPAALNANAVNAAIDTYTTGLCDWTPIANGLSAGFASLAANVEPNTDQYVLLITDGHDTCDGEDASILETNQRAAEGIHTYVVGFNGSGSDLDPDHLNDLACAGRTAPSPASNCQDLGGGNLVAIDSPLPANLFYLATEADDLKDAIDSIGEGVCCNCVD